MQGYVSLHRKLMDNPVWNDSNYLKLWVYCLFKASHKDRKQLIGNVIVDLKRGEFVTGRNSLSDDLNKGVKPKQQLNDLTWFRYLKNLETLGMLNIKTTNKYSVVTIVNYGFYQDTTSNVEQQTEHQMNNKRTSDEQQMNTNNNVNNVNNVNNENKKEIKIRHLEFVLLTETEYSKLIESLGETKLLDYINRLNNYIGQRGKNSYKSHYHTILNWVRKDQEKIVTKSERRHINATDWSNYKDDREQEIPDWAK